MCVLAHRAFITLIVATRCQDDSATVAGPGTSAPGAVMPVRRRATGCSPQAYPAQWVKLRLAGVAVGSDQEKGAPLALLAGARPSQ